MSRIDQALRMREGASDIGAIPTTPDPSALRLYSSEAAEHSVFPEREPDAALEPAGDVPAAAQSATAPRRSSRLRARLVTSTANAVAVEQYRRIAAALHDEQAESGLKTVMITSASPGDGKTLTIVNLALTLAESFARRVLVIDADLRLPALHTTLAIPNHRGLTEALGDERELPFVDICEGLTVLTAGSPRPAPLAGLIGDRMREIIADGEQRFDWVLIDSSPIGVLPDAQLLGRLVGAVILVIGAGSTPAETVERAVEELGGSDAIFGVVLNRIEERRISGARYYGQYSARPLPPRTPPQK
jgi:capsular exopolysaccharide synthesis family protein